MLPSGIQFGMFLEEDSLDEDFYFNLFICISIIIPNLLGSGD